MAIFIFQRLYTDMLINSHKISNIIKPASIKLTSFRSLHGKDDLKTDTFERSDAKVPDVKIEAKDNSDAFQSFLNYARENELVSKIEKVVSSPENYLGSGYEGETYALPGNDDYVVKIYKRSYILPLASEKPVISEIKDITPGLNVGQPVALIKIPCGSSNSLIHYVLRKQQGQTFGIPYELSDFVKESTVKKYNDSLEKLSSSPEHTFEKLVKDTAKVSECGYEFDYNNPDNFFYDDKKHEINFVDINDRSVSNSRQHECVLFGIISGNFLLNYSENEEFKDYLPKTYELLDVISDKYMSAMQNQGEKFSDNEVLDGLIMTGVLFGNRLGSIDDKKEYLRNSNLL